MSGIEEIANFIYENKPVPLVSIYFEGRNYLTIQVTDSDSTEQLMVPVSALTAISEGIKAAMEVLNANG